MTAPYDAIADWYEDTFRPRQPTDLLEYDRVVPEVLGAGSGPCLEVGCGTGAHADRIRDGHWTTESYTDKGIRDKVGASHWPLSELLQMVLAAGLELERFAEGGHPVPLVLAVRARKPERQAPPVR